MRADVLSHFQTVDPVLFSVAQKVGPISVEPKSEYFESLCHIIVGQQLSEKVEKVIWERLVAQLENTVTPEKILATTVEQMREVGLSRSKASFMHDLAQRSLDGRLNLETLPDLNDEEISKVLIEVKGIGPWTIEMFLMFSLGREDIFSVGDLGLRRAIEKLYQIEAATKEDMQRVSAPWAPYRTFASRVLWKSLAL